VLSKALLALERKLFRAWHAFRKDGDRDALQAKLAPVQAEMRRLLDEGSNSLVDGEFCRGILKVWDALWTFVEREGVEPTNNEAERALRHAVVWEKISLGTWSDWGCRFVERIESLVATSRQRGESVLGMLTEAIRAYRAGKKRRPRPTKLEMQARRTAQLAVAAS
jgi:transposase